MLIKDRLFKVEKMSDFLAQQNYQSPSSVRKSQTPNRSHQELDLYNQNRIVYAPTDPMPINPQFYSPPSKKRLNHNGSSPYSLNKGALPPIDELPPIRTPHRIANPHKPRIPSSRSTPKLGMKASPSPSKNGSKQAGLYNQKHIDIEPLEDDKRKMIDYAQIKAFNEKYKLEFVVGYHKNILTRCVELLNTENDPFILENIVPNKYADHILEAEKSRQNHLPSISEFGSQMMRKHDSDGSFISMLPEIRNKGTMNKEIQSLKKGKGFTIDKSIYTISSTQEKQLSTMSSSLSLNCKAALPKLDIETFELALDYYKDNEQDGIFVFFKAPTKGTVSEFGFCEVVFDEKKRNVACMTKYFISRIYRKLKFVQPITVRLLEHLFKVQKLEKLSIKLLAGNTFVQNDLRILGFKLEKIEFEDGKKMKIYSIKKAEVLALLEAIEEQCQA